LFLDKIYVNLHDALMAIYLSPLVRISSTSNSQMRMSSENFIRKRETALHQSLELSLFLTEITLYALPTNRPGNPGKPGSPG
jgi:hypothetical protein